MGLRYVILPFSNFISGLVLTSSFSALRRSSVTRAIWRSRVGDSSAADPAPDGLDIVKKDEESKISEVQ